jgi:hypothetical protein
MPNSNNAEITSPYASSFGEGTGWTPDGSDLPPFSASALAGIEPGSTR